MRIAPRLLVFFILCLVSAGTSQAQITDLTSFNGTNGALPGSNLILRGNTLLGTTQWGGGTGNVGTVFSLPVTGGTPTVLASFNDSTGDQVGGYLFMNGSTLYGTTSSGGTNVPFGTVFSLPVTGGTPHILADLTSEENGPSANLVLSGSTLYGTSLAGGDGGSGAIYSIPVNGGSPTMLADFGNSNLTGPYGHTVLSGGILYGTTQSGGTNGYGAVFSYPVSGGAPTILASFDSTNGSDPVGGLFLSGSNLYGTTASGGANGNGNVFSVPITGGAPTILASFDASSQPIPSGALLQVGNTLYGTTSEGGAYGDGEIFSVPITGGSITVLDSFNGTDGADPGGDLTLSADGTTLYGTTRTGGLHNEGTVFSVPVPEPGSAALLTAGFFGLAARRRQRSGAA